MSRRYRQVALIALVAVLVAFAGCGDTFSGPSEEFDDGENESETTDNGATDTDETDNSTDAGNETEATNDSDTAAESDGDTGEETANESDERDDSTEEVDDSAGEESGSDDDREDTSGDGEDERQDDPDNAGDEDDGDDETELDDQDDTDENETSDDDGEGGDTEPDTFAVTLTVTDTTGEPIEGATVTGEGESHDADIPLEFSGETDTSGVYTDVIYANEYTITIDHPDYEATTVEHTHDGDEADLTAELEAADGADAPPLTVIAVDEDGEPTAADITVWPEDGGGFRGKSLPGEPATFDADAGVYEVIATGSHAEPAAEFAETVVVGDDSVVVEIEVVEQELYDITFEVADAETGNPVEGASVNGEIPILGMTGEHYISGDTDSDGTVTLEGTGGWWWVIADGYEMADLGDTGFDENETVAVDLTPIPTHDLTIEVVDETGDPIEDATVTGEGDSLPGDTPTTFDGTTDSEGQYTTSVYDNTYEIAAEHPDGNATATVTHDHTADGTVTVELPADESESGNESAPNVAPSQSRPVASA